MADTVTIASRLPMAIRITEPEPNPEKPGLSHTLKSVVLNGTNAPGAAGEGITEHVDAGLFKAWSEAQGNADYMPHLRILKDDEADASNPGAGYGFEPGLDALVKDGDNADLAAKGSATTEPGPVPAADMKTAQIDAGTTAGSSKAVPGAVPFPDKK